MLPMLSLEDDELLKEAKEVTGITEEAALVRAGLESLIQREAARRLIRLGGTDPDAQYIRRRAEIDEY